jgi:hypothetical protein
LRGEERVNVHKELHQRALVVRRAGLLELIQSIKLEAVRPAFFRRGVEKVPERQHHLQDGFEMSTGFERLLSLLETVELGIDLFYQIRPLCTDR